MIHGVIGSSAAHDDHQEYHGNNRKFNGSSQHGGSAEAVFTALTKTHKIDASRIKVDYKGDTIQPFAKDVENRVAICIAE